MIAIIARELLKSIVGRIISFIGTASTVAMIVSWLIGSGQRAVVLAAVSGWTLFLATLWALIVKIRTEQQQGTALEQPGSNLWLIDRAAQLETMMVGQRTVNEWGVPTRSRVQWPDGTYGEFHATQTNPNGAIDSFKVTYEPPGGYRKVVCQPTVRRDAVGNVIDRPQMTVS